jgi:hypothetical protein
MFENMKTSSHQKCSSAGRVTSRLLLSFILLATPITAKRDALSRQVQHEQQQPIGILPSLPTIPQTDAQESHEHVFVSIWSGKSQYTHANSDIVITPCLPSWQPRPTCPTCTAGHTPNGFIRVDRERGGTPRRSNSTTGGKEQWNEYTTIKG